LAIGYFQEQYQGGAQQVLPYSEFLASVDAGRVDAVKLGPQRIRGMLKPAAGGEQPKEFVVTRTQDEGLVSRLERNRVRFEAVTESTFLRDMLSWIVPALIIVGFWSYFLRRASASTGQSSVFGLGALGKSKARVFAEKDITTTFADIAGIDEAKQELEELVKFLRDPKRYGRLGGRSPKGILLVGAPGTGKTLVARAVAGEAGVAFFSINGSEFVELFVGLGAARVRDLFVEARATAPCIVFIDELDALGKMRGISLVAGGSNDEKEQTLNQLLAEIDGFDPSKGIVLLAATNRPEVLDPALLRSGRFDKQVLIDRPDRVGRKAILGIHLRKVRMGEGVNLNEVAALTTGFTGADLANLVNEAALIATRRGAEAVEMRDFSEAIERIVAGLERKTRVLGNKEKRQVAYHEMGHATVGLALGGDEGVHKVSIIPRGLAGLGYTMRRPHEDRYLVTKDELERNLAVLVGGRASEEIFLSEISTGAVDDLDKATDIARSMVTRYGMSAEFGLVSYEKPNSPFLSQGGIKGEYSDTTALEIDRETRSLLKQAYEQSTRVLRQHAAVVEAGVALLLKQETLTAEDLDRLWRDNSGQEPERIAV